MDPLRWASEKMYSRLRQQSAAEKKFIAEERFVIKFTCGMLVICCSG